MILATIVVIWIVAGLAGLGFFVCAKRCSGDTPEEREADDRDQLAALRRTRKPARGPAPRRGEREERMTG